MKKIILFCSVGMITTAVYFGCKKEPSAGVVPEGINASELMAKAQNEFTLEEFEIELTAQLNSTGMKTNPADVSYNKIKEVKSEITDLKVEMVTDSTGKIDKSELQRVYNKVRNDVWTAAGQEFSAGKDRVLGFVLDEDIILPKAAVGTIQNVIIKLSGIIGNGVNQTVDCIFSTSYTWGWYESGPPDMLDRLEEVLNSSQCAPPNYFSTCPPPGKAVSGVPLPNGSILLMIDKCLGATPWLCAIWLEELCCLSPPLQPCPGSSFYPSDLDNMVNNARGSALTLAPVCPCGMLSQPNAKPAPIFDLYYYVEVDGNCQTRHIGIRNFWYCCGPCRIASKKIP